MRSPKFDAIIDSVLKAEGYWTEDPTDPGGLTIWGICARDWESDVIKMKVMSQADSREYAKDFYFREYWTPLKVEDLDVHLSYALLDGAVNQGVNLMATWARGLGSEITLDKIIAWRMCRYVEKIEQYPKLERYCFAWMQRLKELYRWSL